MQPRHPSHLSSSFPDPASALSHVLFNAAPSVEQSLLDNKLSISTTKKLMLTRVGNLAQSGANDRYALKIIFVKAIEVGDFYPTWGCWFLTLPITEISVSSSLVATYK